MWCLQHWIITNIPTKWCMIPRSLSFMSIYSLGQKEYEQFITFKVLLIWLNPIYTSKTWLPKGIYFGTFMVEKWSAKCLDLALKVLSNFSFPIISFQSWFLLPLSLFALYWVLVTVNRFNLNGSFSQKAGPLKEVERRRNGCHSLNPEKFLRGMVESPSLEG